MGWREVAELILDDIQKVGPEAPLSADALFAKKAECSVPTVKRAMLELERRGLVIRRRGRKTLTSQRGVIVRGSEFSFSNSAKERGAQIVTRLLEKSCRVPDRTSPLEIEIRAQKALGLKRDEPFFVISRLRVLDGSPRVIHRSFLNPANYVPAFLALHDFEKESLLGIIEKYALRFHSRETRIRADFPTDMERDLLAIAQEPVLNVEQSMRAFSSASGSLVTAEYLHATYSRWEYTIHDRQ